MILTPKLKTWLLVSHAFILIGMGHGIAPFIVVEFLWLFKICTGSFHEIPNSNKISFDMAALVAFSSLFGQLAIILSFWINRKKAKLFLYFSGIGLLILSVVSFANGIKNDSYSALVGFSCIPFLYFIVRTVAGKSLYENWFKFLDKIS